MHGLSRSVRRLAALGIALAAMSLVGSMLLIVYAVVLRYFFNQPPAWVDELVAYLLVAGVMLAAADALLQGEHIGVDVLIERLGARGRKVALLAGLVAAAATGILLVSEGIDMVGFSRMVDLRSNGYLATPMWIPQLLVPLGAAMMVLAALVRFLEAVHEAPERPGGDAPGSPPPAG